MRYKIDDVLETTKAVSGKTIRLTIRQWVHVVESHDYMAGNVSHIMETVNSPDCLAQGSKGELIAIRFYPHTNLGEKHCIVVYKENDDGFIITAFFTSKPETIKRRGIIWQK